ncbi:cell division protein FtsQ/DivIB [Arthrobacter antioxidans]|uniref:cell division protein FtsQ/DivIB n=1 Tax=Arthrobacter antioxidans TaxID=2895818 RepID=UPI001FFF02CB|nr:FtsQ-type POTRA domain-containing protein [Arthrobacter antioxidans]
MTPRKPPATRATGAPGTRGTRAPGTGGATGTRGSTATLTGSPGRGASGTVLDFPAPRRSRRLRNTVIAVAAVVLVLGGLVAYVVFSPALALRTVSVQGNALVPTSEVEAALAPLTGTPLTRISREQVADLLADKAPIEDVRIAAEPPSTLVVTVEERVPVAVLQTGREFMLIDAEGRQLMQVAQRGDAKLPLIDGGANAVNSEVFSSITAVLAELPVSILSRLNSASASSVDSIQLSLSGEQRIFWGSAERSAEKAGVLEAMLSLPTADPPVEVFDVSTPDRPVTR